jgi:predicted secreted hydrolase
MSLIRRKARCGARAAAIVLLVLAAAAAGAEAWRTADGPRTWMFPKDYGAHPAYKTEWWYFTGNLAGPAGEKYGYELTFFRNGVRAAPSDPANPWSIRDLFLAHFTLTDVAGETFHAEDILSRSGPDLAGARTESLDVWIGDWSARMKDGAISLRARRRGWEIALELAPRKPVVLHGRSGYSRKGPGNGQASYYSSLTDLDTQGAIAFGGGGRKTVRGRSWFDHEFGSGFLAEDQVGWDWFGLHLSDGRDLMIYLLRRKDGSIERASAGTLVAPDGSARPLALRGDRERGDDTIEFSVTTLDRWRSPKSGGTYPSRWRIKIPSEEIDLLVAPLVAAQELLPVTLPNLIYWEGAVAGTGTVRGRPAACEGYAELTGYAGSLRGAF